LSPSERAEFVERRRQEKVITITDPASVGAVTRPARQVRVKTPPQYVVRLHDVVALPRQVLLSGTSLLPDSFRRHNPNHAHVALERTGDKFRTKRPTDVRNVIDQPVYYLDGEHMGHFGHFTLEVLPRLWFWHRFRAETKPKIVCSLLKPFALELLRPFGIAEDDIYILNEPTLFRDLTVASSGYALEKGVDETAFQVWRTIADFYDKNSDLKRIYVSRSKWPKQRILVNEADVEKLFAAYGFTILHPQNLTVAEQVAIFRNAEVIAGPSGSALYNCVYSARKGARLILASSRFITLNDALINVGTNSETHYVTGATIDDRNGMFADWTIDIGTLEKCIRATVLKAE
jgi:capsular polysaccharide biosynthesis protein